MSERLSSLEGMQVRLIIQVPGQAQADTVTGEGPDYESGLADAKAKVPDGWKPIAILVDRPGRA